MTKDERKIYAWGRSINELSDNPNFETIQQMLDEIINRLETTLSDDEPAGSEYGYIMARRTGKVAGLKDFKTVMSQYRNFYLKNVNKNIEED